MTAVLDARVPDLLDDLVRTAPPAPAVHGLAARARALDISRRLFIALRAIGSVTGLWITRHGLVSSTPAGADVEGHVARIDFALHELFPHGRLDGWFPVLGGGYRLFTVNGPGLAVLAGIVRALSIGGASTAEALAVLGSLSIAALPWAVAMLSRELGATCMAAAVHGLLALFISFYAGGGLAGLYGPGLVAQSIALPLQVATLALVVRAMRHGNRRTLGTAAAAVAGLALLHPISILVLALFAPSGMSREWLGAPVRRVVRGVAVALWAAALAGFWLVPALRWRELQGDATAWGIPPLPTRIGEVMRGDVLFPRPVAWAVAVAAAATLGTAVLGGRPSWGRRLVPFVGALVFLFVAHLAAGHGLGPRELRVQLPTRGLALAAILLLQPLAELLGQLAMALCGVLAGGSGRHDIRAAVSLSAAVGLALAVPWQLHGLLDPPQVAVPAAPSLRAAAAELHELVPPMGRHLLVIPPTPEIGTDNPSRWLTVASGTNSAHLYFWEATKENTAGVLAADLLLSIDPATAVDGLRRAGVTHVVTADLGQATALDQTGAFRTVWQQDDVTIQQLLSAPGHPAPGDLLQPAAEEPLALVLTAKPVEQRAEHLRWSAENPAANRSPLAVVAAVAYDPGWHATVDGTAAPVRRSSDGFVELDLPVGRHRVDLRFDGARPDPAGVMLTLGGLLALLLLCWPSRNGEGGGRHHDVVARSGSTGGRAVTGRSHDHRRDGPGARACGPPRRRSAAGGRRRPARGRRAGARCRSALGLG